METQRAPAMNTTDLRNLTWEKLQPMLTGQRLAVLNAWRRLGAGTTRQLAQRSGIDLLTFRPRSTELYALGLLVLDGREDTQGVYRAVPERDARAAFEGAQRAAAGPEQTLLKLPH